MTFEGGEQVDEVSAGSDEYRDFVMEHFGFDPYEGYEDEDEEEAAEALPNAVNGN